jgi:hypothetical protein
MRFAVFFIAMFLLSSAISANTDVVTFGNGNVLIGEVKYLERGKLTFDTESMGLIQIDWAAVNSLVTKQNFQLELSSGARSLGTLGVAQEAGLLSLETLGQTIAIPSELVVKMNKIETAFVDRFNVDIRTGYNYTKGSGVAQFNLGLGLEYRTEKRSATMELSSLITDTEENSTERTDLAFGIRGLRDNRWFTGGVLKFQQNDELDIDLRTSAGGGIGRILSESSNHHFDLLGGFLLSRENLTVIDEVSDTSLEGMIAANFDWFKFTTPELDIKSTLAIYPGITDAGRLRAEYDLRFRWEMVKDMFWELRYYYNYDSGRKSANESINDYGIITSLGYKF